jgi:hypothetical protein
MDVIKLISGLRFLRFPIGHAGLRDGPDRPGQSVVRRRQSTVARGAKIARSASDHRRAAAIGCCTGQALIATAGEPGTTLNPDPAATDPAARSWHRQDR